LTVSFVRPASAIAYLLIVSFICVVFLVLRLFLYIVEILLLSRFHSHGIIIICSYIYCRRIVKKFYALSQTFILILSLHLSHVSHINFLTISLYIIIIIVILLYLLLFIIIDISIYYYYYYYHYYYYYYHYASTTIRYNDWYSCVTSRKIKICAISILICKTRRCRHSVR